MSALETLVKLAERRARDAVLVWQRLDRRRNDAQTKLARLQKHEEGYRDLMRAGLQDGMPAAAIVPHFNFIAQIEAVIANQRDELKQLEAACAQHWEALVEARRERRVYEMLKERAGAREAALAARQQQTEIGDMLQRAARGPAAPGSPSNNRNFAWPM
jgi:flagellar export protein FliJ